MTNNNKLTERQRQVLQALSEAKHGLYDFVPCFMFRGNGNVFKSLEKRHYIHRDLNNSKVWITYAGRDALEAEMDADQTVVTLTEAGAEVLS